MRDACVWEACAGKGVGGKCRTFIDAVYIMS
jgi:hypothetical protein